MRYLNDINKTLMVVCCITNWVNYEMSLLKVISDLYLQTTNLTPLSYIQMVNERTVVSIRKSSLNVNKKEYQCLFRQ